MCTATWLHRPGGYDLLFNRDELKSRAEADPPRRQEGDGTAWLAPVDGDFGGTWIATNAFGVTVALLNGYHRADAEAAERRSRGLLVLDLAPARDADDVFRRLDEADPARHRTFRLIVLSPDAPVRLAEWDGHRLRVDPDATSRRPLVSSSFDEGRVGEARRAEYHRRFGEAPPTVESLRAFHAATTGGPSAYSVSMERPEAQTRSFTHVTVGPDRVGMRYLPGRPDLAASPESALQLPRQPLPSRAFPPPEES